MALGSYDKVSPRPVHCFSIFEITLSDLFGILLGAIAYAAWMSPHWLLVGLLGVDGQSSVEAVVLHEDHDIGANGGMCRETEPMWVPQPKACVHALSAA